MKEVQESCGLDREALTADQGEALEGTVTKGIFLGVLQAESTSEASHRENV